MSINSRCCIIQDCALARRPARLKGATYGLVGAAQTTRLGALRTEDEIHFQRHPSRGGLA